MKEKSLEIKKIHIKYVFTEEEKKDIAAELAQKFSEKEALELQKKEVASKITSEINAANTAATRLSKEYSQGYTYKNADCYEIFDYDSKQVFVHRADTDDQVQVRTMTAIEFQREIFDPREEVKTIEEDFFPDDEDPKKVVEYFNDELLKDETITKGVK